MQGQNNQQQQPPMQFVPYYPCLGTPFQPLVIPNIPKMSQLQPVSAYSFPVNYNLCLPKMSVQIPVIPNNHAVSQKKGNGSPLYTICEEEKEMSPLATPYTPNSNVSPSPTPSMSVSSSSTSMSSMCLNLPHAVFVKQYFPAFAARAELNMFIPSTLTEKIMHSDCEILEEFSSAAEFYYYLNIGMAFQINDSQINIFCVNNEQHVMFIHYDLHQKGTKQDLYAVAIPNSGHSAKRNKWEWKLHCFMTAMDIFQTFGVSANMLPVSSRKMTAFRTKLSTQWKLAQQIHPNAVKNAVWSSIQTIKQRKKRGRHSNLNKFAISENEWIQIVLSSWNRFPAIPIVVDGNKNGICAHWIEWVKPVDLTKYGGGFIGISCRYKQNDGWVVSSICLDRGDVVNKHRLVGLSSKDTLCYAKYFNAFNTKYTDIEWIN